MSSRRLCPPKLRSRFSAARIKPMEQISSVQESICRIEKGLLNQWGSFSASSAVMPSKAKNR